LRRNKWDAVERVLTRFRGSVTGSRTLAVSIFMK
jgi:hypothetical protein